MPCNHGEWTRLSQPAAEGAAHQWARQHSGGQSRNVAHLQRKVHRAVHIGVHAQLAALVCHRGPKPGQQRGEALHCRAALQGWKQARARSGLAAVVQCGRALAWQAASSTMRGRAGHAHPRRRGRVPSSWRNWLCRRTPLPPRPHLQAQLGLHAHGPSNQGIDPSCIVRAQRVLVAAGGDGIVGCLRHRAGQELGSGVLDGGEAHAGGDAGVGRQGHHKAAALRVARLAAQQEAGHVCGEREGSSASQRRARAGGTAWFAWPMVSGGGQVDWLWVGAFLQLQAGGMPWACPNPGSAWNSVAPALRLACRIGCVQRRELCPGLNIVAHGLRISRQAACSAEKRSWGGLVRVGCMHLLQRGPTLHTLP